MYSSLPAPLLPAGKPQKSERCGKGKEREIPDTLQRGNNVMKAVVEHAQAHKPDEKDREIFPEKPHMNQYISSEVSSINPTRSDAGSEVP
ncbi:MAG TPA: hypothetical protein PKY45_16695 [Deltaproteobacteria bacterium]|nr:hypothetical protein [Deltaproteobacteria bacterium]